MNRVAKVFKAGSAVRLATYLLALWKLTRHPDTPRGAKLLALCVLAYALSPIDLIPDFIPILGMLDEIILVPLGVALVLRMTPKPLWEACLREAQISTDKLPRSWRGAVVIAMVWAVVLGAGAWWAAGALGWR